MLWKLVENVKYEDIYEVTFVVRMFLWNNDVVDERAFPARLRPVSLCEVFPSQRNGNDVYLLLTFSLFLIVLCSSRILDHVIEEKRCLTSDRDVSEFTKCVERNDSKNKQMSEFKITAQHPRVAVDRL